MGFAMMPMRPRRAVINLPPPAAAGEDALSTAGTGEQDESGHGTLRDDAARVAGILNRIERLGNSLPHPARALCRPGPWGGPSLGASGGALSWSAIHPVTGAEVKAISLLDGPGIRRMLEGTVRNFTSFAPFGTVLVAMLGLGIAERSGLLGALLAASSARLDPPSSASVVVCRGALPASPPTQATWY